MINLNFKKHELPKWINNKFIPHSQLFPNWNESEAKQLLTLFTENTKGWDVKIINNNLDIGLQFPIIIYQDDNKQETSIPMIETFPDQYQPKIQKICLTLIQDYLPNLTHLTKNPNPNETKFLILNEIYTHEKKIEMLKGRKILKELKFRLGLWGFSF